jgi:hypothetical protein
MDHATSGDGQLGARCQFTWSQAKAGELFLLATLQRLNYQALIALLRGKASLPKNYD